jgi:gliding motility-associated-like protein
LPSFTIQYSGFKNGENASVINIQPVVNVSMPATAGTYALTPAGGDDDNYSFAYIEGVLTVYQTPSVPVITAINNKTEFCEGDETILTAAAANAAAYTWSTGANGSSITVRNAGNYTVTAKSTEGCSSAVSSPVAIIVNPLPAGVIIQTATGPGVISGYTLTAPVGTDYKWNTGETTASIVTKSSGDYHVTVTNQHDCSKEFVTQVTLLTISIPNTFSPNGDGINDYWIIPELRNYSPVYVVIVNREGQTVFESKNFTRWDGRYKGKDLPSGVYFYRVTAGANKAMQGWLNLVR